MASIVLGSIVADIRGPVGSETYSRAQGGHTVRARSNPAQPSSGLRDQTQANFTAASQGWSGRLSAAQRTAWHAYGARYPRPNRWGESSIVSGYLAFVRCNCALKTINAAWWIDDPPELGMLPMPVFTFQFFDWDPDYWVDLDSPIDYIPVDNDYVIFSMGKTTNVGVNYYSTPWRLWWVMNYDVDHWDNDFQGEAIPAWSGTNTRLWMRAFVINIDTGRLSVHYQTYDDAFVIGKGIKPGDPGWGSLQAYLAKKKP